MSKSNMLLGLAKGKVGDLVFYRDGGEQRTRTRVIPKNPRTAAQMAQRVKIANVAGLYRAAANIFKDSFTNRPSNRSGYNEFAALAIVNAPYLTRQQAAAAVVLPQPAMVSRGVLPSLEYSEANTPEVMRIAIAAPFSSTQPETNGAVSRVLLDTYSFMQEGDELTFCTIKFTPVEGVDAEVDVYSTSMFTNSFIIDTTSTAAHDSQAVVSSASGLTGTTAGVWGADEVALSFIILSRVDPDGKLQVSTQWAYLSSAAQTLYDGYRSEEALRDAIESYKASATPILR